MVIDNRAGDLRQRVEIQSRAQSRTSHGGFANVWTTLATVWASVEPLSGSEFPNANAQTVELTHRVRIRYYAGLDSAMRLLYRGRYLNIIAVRNLEERRIIHELDCKEDESASPELLNDADEIVLNDSNEAILVG